MIDCQNAQQQNDVIDSDHVIHILALYRCGPPAPIPLLVLPTALKKLLPGQ